MRQPETEGRPPPTAFCPLPTAYCISIAKDRRHRTKPGKIWPRTRRARLACFFHSNYFTAKVNIKNLHHAKISEKIGRHNHDNRYDRPQHLTHNPGRPRDDSPPSRNTVKRILRENGFDPAPKRGEGTWDEFLKLHAETLWQADFMSVRSLTTRGIQQLFVIVFIHVTSMIATRSSRPRSMNP